MKFAYARLSQSASRRPLFEWIAVIAVLVLSAITSVNFAWSEQRMTEGAEAARLAAQARIVDDQLRRQLGNLRAAMEDVLSPQQGSTSACGARCLASILASSRKTIPDLRMLLVIDGDGIIQQAVPRQAAMEASGRALADYATSIRDPHRLYLLPSAYVPALQSSGDTAVLLPASGGGAVVAVVGKEFFNAAIQPALYARDMRCIIADEDGQRIVALPEISSPTPDPMDATTGKRAEDKEERLIVRRALSSADSGLDRVLVVSVSRDAGELLWPIRHLMYVCGVAWLVLAFASVTVLVTVQWRRKALFESSQRYQAERAAAAARIDLALENGGLGLWEWELPLNRIRYDARGATMIGLTIEQAEHEAFSTMDVHPDDAALVQRCLVMHLDGTAVAFDVEYRHRHASGAWIWIHSRGKIVKRDASSRPLRIVGTCHDISARKQVEAEIQHLAFYDSLTDLPNRRLLYDRLGQALAKKVRQRRAGAVLFIDLDNFKKLNDTLGHDMGDRFLRQVAQRLLGAVRDADTVARLSGDEFVILLEDLDNLAGTAEDNAALVAQKIIEALSSPYCVGRHEVHVTPSIGITIFGGQDRPVEDFIKQADLAMYEAKAAGKNTYRFFAPIMQFMLDEQAQIESDLRHAISGQQLVLHFQPIIDDTGRTICAEALVRWNHPERGLLGPGQFVPIAEKSGLILSVGQWVLQEACKQLAQWSRIANDDRVQVAVNVSARQFRQEDFVDQVMHALRQSGTDPHRLKLELTESVVVDDIEDVIVKMRALKAHGVSFALDDFGTGYSSLSYLQRLPLDQLKIDKSFVHDMLTSKNSATIVKAIVNLAGSLDMDVVAEGVGTEPQRQFLAACDCRCYQGYLISRPVPPEDILSYWRQAA